MGLHKTAARQRLSTTREDQVGQTMTGAYAQTEIEWARSGRRSACERMSISFYVTSKEPPIPVTGQTVRESEALGRVRTWHATEFYANAGWVSTATMRAAPGSASIR